MEQFNCHSEKCYDEVFFESRTGGSLRYSRDDKDVIYHIFNFFFIQIKIFIPKIQKENIEDNKGTINGFSV